MFLLITRMLISIQNINIIVELIINQWGVLWIELLKKC
jgi:hypothetical protein